MNDTTTKREALPASCADCAWEGRRLWPSPIKPCPKCGGTTIGRVYRRHGYYKETLILPWEEQPWTRAAAGRAALTEEQGHG